ncbi:uncharacterized protein ISCGN_022201 [Ixodes scapularis]
MANPPTRRHGAMKIRLTVLCAKNLSKKDFFRLPDPFCKISVDGSGQCHSTDACKNTLDPKWNQHYDLYSTVRELQEYNHLMSSMRSILLDRFLTDLCLEHVLPLLTGGQAGPDFAAVLRCFFGVVCNGGRHFPAFVKMED